MESIYDEIIEIIKLKKLEIGNKDAQEIPSIYYIGMPKTASASLMISFPKNTVAHWHSTRYFESLYKTRSLSKNGKDIFDLIDYIGKKYKFVPLIIESIREPIANLISLIMQHLRKERAACICDLCNWMRNGAQLDEKFLALIKKNISIDKWISNIISIKDWKKHYGVEPEINFVKYFYYNSKRIKLLLIRFEDVLERTELFKKLRYKYNDRILNLNDKNPLIRTIYDYVKNNIKFNENELEQFYENKTFKYFYSEEDIALFKDRYIEKMPKMIKNYLENEISLIGKVHNTKNYIEIDDDNNQEEEIVNNSEVIQEYSTKNNRIINPFVRLSNNINSPSYNKYVKNGSFSFSHLQYINRY